MDKHTSIREVKAAIKKAIRYADEYEVTVKVYDCDESGEQTYDVETTLYVDGEYVDTYVTETYHEGEEKAAIKRAQAVRKSMKNDFDVVDTEILYTM